jgi:vacuolar-type H+-ATPase subunit E/Vma4
MSTNVGQMSTEELKEIIGSVVEEKLKEILGDPDEGLDITAAIRERLVQQKKAVASGERGEELDDVVGRLGLT